MASSLILSPLCSPTLPNNRELASTFISSPSFSFRPSVRRRRLNGLRGYCYRSPVANSLDHIPKQFRQENLKDGVLDNYKNVPQHLYGLPPSQLDMFMTEDNPAQQQSESVTEESISSAYNYLKNGGMRSISAMNARGPTKCSMSLNMRTGGARRSGRRSPPPDLPSLLLDNRIVFLGLPIVPAVAQLIVAQFIWLDYENKPDPIYLYVNSSGTQNDNREIVGSETDAYAIADAMELCKADVYTVNIGMAYGQAAMLMSLGKKGFRGLQPHATNVIHLPKASPSSGVATDMWIRARDLDVNTEHYLELLAKGTGKSKEELRKLMMRGRVTLKGQTAIDFGLADRIIDSKYQSFKIRSKEERPARA